VVATGDKLLAGAISQQALDLRTMQAAPASRLPTARWCRGNISPATSCGIRRQGRARRSWVCQEVCGPSSFLGALRELPTCRWWAVLCPLNGAFSCAGPGFLTGFDDPPRSRGAGNRRRSNREMARPLGVCIELVVRTPCPRWLIFFILIVFLEQGVFA